MKFQPRIEIVNLRTREVIDKVPLHNTNQRPVERVMAGLLRNMDTDRFAAKEILTPADEKKP